MTYRDDRRFAYIEVAGGKFDGDHVRVELDTDGRPPAIWNGCELVRNTAPLPPHLPPHLARRPGILDTLYTLTEVPTGDGGTKLVYRCDVTIFDDLGVGAQYNPDDPFGVGYRAA